MRKPIQYMGLALLLAFAGGTAPAWSAIEPTEALQAQQSSCQGVVKDLAGEPVIGASVVVKGQPSGAITDAEGRFTLAGAKSGDMLTVSYLGYQTEEVRYRGRQLQITLKEDAKALGEVVVVGFGSQKKVNLTGAISSVKMDEVAGDRPIISAADALQGAVPGLFISSNGNDAGNGKNFQIRGAYSVGAKDGNGNYGATIAPLILIDNVEGDIDMLNPEDIESISVLKDAASAAIYGARAAGGVILITTKNPKKKTDFTLNYNNNFAFTAATNMPKQAPLMSYLKAYKDCDGNDFWNGGGKMDKWMQYLDEYRQNPAAFETKGDGIYRDADGGFYYLNEKDLADNMLETGFQMQHKVSANGGTDHLRYRLSGAYVNNDGVLITNKDKYRRMNLSAFISADITKWFTQEATVSYSNTRKSMPKSTLDFYSTRLVNFYPEGNFPAEWGNSDTDLPTFTGKNQILWANPETTKRDNTRILLRSVIKPTKGLEAVFEYTYNRKNYDYSWYTGLTKYNTIERSENTTPTEDYLHKKKQQTEYNAFNIYATYQRDFGQHKLRVMAGFNQESYHQDYLDAYSYGQAVIEVPALSSGTSTIKAIDGYNEYAVRGGYFRVNYNYAERYLLEVNGRYDGSSRFPADSRFCFNPSVSAGWQIAEENFMKGTRKWLDGLKLRASYGVIGNQNIPSYAFIPSMSVNNKYNGWLQNGGYVTAVSSLPALVSSSFTWEKVHNIDLGIDFTLFHNRLNGTFDWYQRNTKGMLAPGMDLPAIVGAKAPYQNTADMRTNGWEAQLTWRDRIGKVGYTIGFNIADATNEITKYDANTSKLLSNFYTGQKLGEIWGYVADGYFTAADFESTSTWKLKDGITAIEGINPRPGDLKFQNLRDDDRTTNVINAGDNTYDNPGDRRVIGNNTPRYQYGITLGVNYAGFDLRIFLQGTAKRDAWVANTITFPLYTDHKFVPLYEGLEDYWQPTDPDNDNWEPINPDAEFPRIYQSYGNQGSNYRISDRYLKDASYLRIKNITLSYTLPKALTRKCYLRAAKAFLSVENLATFSSLPKGIDPETLYWNYPQFRTVSFGINVTL